MGTLLVNAVLVSTLVVMVLAFGIVIRRLLGVRMGVVRTLLVAVLALWMSGVLMRAMLPRPELGDPLTALL